MDDGHRRRLLVLSLVLAAPAAAPSAPAGGPADDEEFAALLEFLGDPELADQGWDSFLDGLLGAAPEPVPASPAPADAGRARLPRGARHE